MIGLADLADADTSTWAQAARRFALPDATQYNIAADCLRASPDKVAIITVNGNALHHTTYRHLDDASARFASLLTAAGIRRGDRVAVKLPQGVAMATAVLGTLRLGAILVTISGVVGRDAAAHRLHDSGSKVLVCHGDPTENDLASQSGARLIRVGPGWLDTFVPAAAFADTRRDDPALLLYTSGTTGMSKGVLHAHRVLLGHHATDLGWDHVRAGDVAYSPVDWAWGGGLFLGLLSPLAYGMSVVAFRESRFDPARVVDVMGRTGVTVGLFPPTALRAMRRSPALGGRASSKLRVRALITGAEAVEPELLEWARDEWGLSINNAFGQTEANILFGHSHVLGDLPTDTLGLPYPGHQIAVLDHRHNPVPPGVTGEIAVRADDPVCMLEYWNNPEATAAKFANGWLLTGDSGEVDEEGRLVYRGRSDDLIKSGGYRVGPAEIEAAMFTHPAVDRCAAVGIPDDQRGQRIVAYVVLATGHLPTDDLTAELKQLVRTRVGAHAYPRLLRYVDALPLTSTGKINRRALRDAAG